MELSIQMKTYLVLGVMLGCFIVLYPTIFHPMIKQVLGLNPPPRNIEDSLLHPRERAMRSGGHAGPPPYPAHTGAGAMPKSAPSSGRGSSLMTMVLPLYAIGIVIYLVYTLAKVFGGDSSRNKDKKEKLLREYYKNFYYDPNRSEFRMGRQPFPGADDDEHEQESTSGPFDAFFPGTEMHRGNMAPNPYENPIDPNGMGAQRGRTLPQDLEYLLQKVDDKNISGEELRLLRERLEETEQQMTRILQAMQQVQQQQEENVYQDVPPDSTTPDCPEDQVPEQIEEDTTQNAQDELEENDKPSAAEPLMEEKEGPRHRTHEPVATS